MSKNTTAIDYSARAKKAWATRRKMAKEAKKALQGPNAKPKKKSNHQKN